MSKEWPLEGHFGCGGSGLFVTTDCLGRAFTSRTANYDLIIGLPQLSTVQRPRVLARLSGITAHETRESGPTKEMSSGEWHMGTPLSSSVAGTTQRSQPTTTNSSLPPTTS